MSGLFGFPWKAIRAGIATAQCVRVRVCVQVCDAGLLLAALSVEQVGAETRAVGVPNGERSGEDAEDEERLRVCLILDILCSLAPA